jgi:carboxyl-terminal processing protease
MKRSLRSVFVLAAIALMALAFLAGTQYGSVASGSSYQLAGVNGGAGADKNDVQDVSLRPVEEIQEVMTLLRQNYITGIQSKDEAKLTYSAIRGMLYGLGDPYTRFLDPEEFRDFDRESAGYFDGIGATLELLPTENAAAETAKKTSSAPKNDKDKDALPTSHFLCPVCSADSSNPIPYRITSSSAKGFEAEYVQEPTYFRHYRVTVVSPIIGGPAERAGVKAGDQIIEVDGKSTYGMTLPEAVRNIKGPAGTTVTLLVNRKASAKPITFKLVRTKVDIPTVEEKMLSGKIGYLRLNAFNAGSADKTAQALTSLRSKGMKGLVLDLRNNGGGGLEVCLKIASMLLPEGPIVQIQARGGETVVRSTIKDTRGLGLPLVVIVNEASASASEILAGALQDRQAAKLVGARTFGKGLVQTVIRLKDASAVIITTAKYYTPKHHEVNGLGIKPDELVKQPEGVVTLLSDQDLQAKAALKLLNQSIAEKDDGQILQSRAAVPVAVH